MGERWRILTLFLLGSLLSSSFILSAPVSDAEYIDPMYYHDEPLWKSNATFLGESANDYAGKEVSICGDVNNDGYDDILIGAPTNSENGIESGQVYLILGKRDGFIMDMNLSNSSASFLGEKPGDMLGLTLAGAGDVNGDGYDDILMSAGNYLENPSGSGKVYLVLGKEKDWEMDTNISTCSASFFGEMVEDRFGCSVSGVGDVDSDGFDDFAMGASHSDFGGNQSGKVYLVYGKRTGWKKDQNASAADAAFYGFDDWKRLGRNVHGGGDINGDGISDMMFSSCGRRVDGRVRVFFGNRIRWKGNLNVSISNVSIDGPANGHLGIDVDSIGDLNRDGINDLIMGSPSYPQGGATQAGTVYAILGRTSGWKKLYRIGRGEYDLRLTGERSYGYIGNSISYIGDINFDGFDDFIAGGFASGGYLNGGKTYLVLGRERFKPRNLSFGDMNASFIGTRQEYSGYSVSGKGDVNGDGTPDILISAPRNMSKGRYSGAVYLIFPNSTHAPVEVTQFKVYSDPGCSREINWTTINSTVYIQVVGQDSDPLSRDRAMVVVNGGYVYDHIIWLDEVGTNTGTYRSELIVSTDKTSGKNVRTRVGHILIMESRESEGLTAELFIGVPVEIQPRPVDLTIFEDEFMSMEFRSVGMNPISSWDVSSDPNDWLAWDTDENRLAGIPLNDDIGVIDVRITLRDVYGYTDTHGFSITVLNTPPEILNTSKNMTLEDEVYRMDYDSSDDPSGMASWKLSTNATWLDIDHLSGVIFGIPDNDDVGFFEVNITVEDGNGGSDWQDYTLQVIDVNDAPVIIGSDQFTIFEDHHYLVDYDAVDIDDPSIFIWSLVTDANWLSLDEATGVLSGDPTQEDIGIYHVNLSVSDERGGIDFRKFELTVIEVNDDPFWLNVPGDVVLSIGEEYSFDVNASDPDPEDILVFSIDSYPRSNISIDPDMGKIFWIASLEPFPTDPYILTVHLSVSDGKTMIFHSFEIEVLPLPVPYVTLISPLEDEKVSCINVNINWELSFIPKDQGKIQYNVYYSNDEFTLKDLPGLQCILIINGSTTCFLKDVSPGDLIHWTVIPVTEKTSGFCIDGIHSFRINNPPIIQPVEDISIEAGTELRLRLAGMDDDEDDMNNLEYNIVSAPSELFIDRTTGFILWETTITDVGNHSISIRLCDGTDNIGITFSVMVYAPQKEPEPEEDPDFPYVILIILITAIVMVLVSIVIYFRMRKGIADDSKLDPFPDKEGD